jgi:hypothetical protein
MARKTVKKRVPPRKVVVPNSLSYQKVKDLIERNFVQDPTSDPFEIAAPKGKAYQWASVHPDQKHDFDVYKRAGWRPVPASRHPDFPSEKGKIIFGGSMLLEMPRKKYENLSGSGIARAKAQLSDQNKVLGLEDNDGAVRRMAIMSDSFIASEAYDAPNDDGFEDVSVSIVVRIPYRWRDAAACMKISAEEYARRRLIMYSHGHSGGLLIPIEPPKENGWDQIPQHAMVPFQYIESAVFQFKRGDK